MNLLDRRRISRALYLIPLSLLLQSCTNNFEIVNEPSGSHVVTFYEPQFLWSKRIEPCLKWLQVYDQSGREHLVWSMTARAGTCVKVKAVLIGSAVEGFKISGVKPAIGHQISVGAESGDGRVGSSVAFTIKH